MSRQEDYAFEDEQGEHAGTRLLREVLEVAILTLLFFGAVRMLVQNYRVDGPSMQQTLYTNEYILVDKATYYFHSPQRGDVTHCDRRTVLGILNRDGAHAEYVTLPTVNLHVVPPNVSDAQAVFTEPLAAA